MCSDPRDDRPKTSDRLWAAALTVVAFSPSALALQPATDLETRVRTADLIVLAEPTSTECRPTLPALQLDWRIETEVDLTPLETWKGTAPADLSLVLPGGRLGELEVVVEDVPTLVPGQPTVLLLADTPVGWVVVGGEAGAIPVRVDAGDEGRPVEQVRRVLQRFVPGPDEGIAP